MRKFILIGAIALGISGCGVDKNLLTEVEAKNWSNRNDTIFYHQLPVAVFTHFEVELYRGRTDKEICLSALDIDTMNLEPEIIRYVHTKHPEDKVQFTPMYREFKNNHKNE
jgi:predicted transcriptional regulator